MLVVSPPAYALGGSVARPWRLRPTKVAIDRLEDFEAFSEPGWTKYLTDLELIAERGGVRLSTQTRGYSTDDRARRRFFAYWLLIRLPSGLIRRELLRAVARKAADQG